VLPLKGKIRCRARFDKILQSEEIKNIITVLGTGVGKEEYNIDNIRYHKVIIMTDADVDGSHIRTLLLTFFYRQMREMIDKGFLYIAQPPLLKVGKGKDEMYLKDESELDDWILKKVCEQKHVTFGQEQKALSGHSLYLFSTNLAAYLHILKLLQKRGITPELAEILTDADLDDKIFSKMKAHGGLKDLDLTGYTVEGPSLNVERGVHELFVSSQQPGEDLLFSGPESRMSSSIKVGRGLISSNEFQKCIDLKKKISAYNQAPFAVHSNEKDGEAFKARNKEELLDYLLKEGKKGLSVQRYKGLGEMNPTQLGENHHESEPGNATCFRSRLRILWTPTRPSPF
jgi:DNA gyrase subunit B